MFLSVHFSLLSCSEGKLEPEVPKFHSEQENVPFSSINHEELLSLRATPLCFPTLSNISSFRPRLLLWPRPGTHPDRSVLGGLSLRGHTATVCVCVCVSHDLWTKTRLSVRVTHINFFHLLLLKTKLLPVFMLFSSPFVVITAGTIQ